MGTILLESSDDLLLESGSMFLLEAPLAVVVPGRTIGWREPAATRWAEPAIIAWREPAITRGGDQ